MLVGGSPGSMAGGLKTTTLVILILTIRAYLRGTPTVHLNKRTISDSICREAMVIIFYYLLMVFTFYFVLLLTEPALQAKYGDFVLFYEVSSAFGTVGLSLNATPLLSPIGKGLIALAMFLGRIGPISIAFMMARREISHRIRYPEETITVG
jgi:trk system potassium uptake protein TrkH